ncbi:MAG: VOC family protein [Nitrospinae bacterium]|nr:VOC family protein [Nitrospinota bacterium]
MTVTFKGAPIFVSDMKNARWFYENVLGQTPMIVTDGYVAYEGGVAVWEKGIAGGMIHGAPYDGPLGSEVFELYFESDDIDAAWGRASELGAKVQNPLAEAPWGQKSFRLRDPDEYLVEIAEPMTAVVARLLAGGMSVAEVSRKTYMPPTVVEGIAAK